MLRLSLDDDSSQFGNKHVNICVGICPRMRAVIFAQPSSTLARDRQMVFRGCVGPCHSFVVARRYARSLPRSHCAKNARTFEMKQPELEVGTEGTAKNLTRFFSSFLSVLSSCSALVNALW